MQSGMLNGTYHIPYDKLWDNVIIPLHKRFALFRRVGIFTFNASSVPPVNLSENVTRCSQLLYL